MAAPLPWTVCQNFFHSANQTIVTGAETVVLAMGPIDSQTPGRPVVFSGTLLIGLSPNTTAVQALIRQDSLTGAPIGNVTVNVAPATITETPIPILALDSTPVEMAGRTYVLTVQCQGATANSTVGATLVTVYS